LIFASEIKGLLASGLVSRQIDRQAVWQYLALGAIPQPRTILADASALMPGHAMTVGSRSTSRSGGTGISRKFGAIVSRCKGHLAEDAERTLRALLDEATRYHLVSDVPVGAFLSGGIDSTAVVG
jgi:asparagine synthase (glutamine-hydrolysing)